MGKNIPVLHRYIPSVTKSYFEKNYEILSLFYLYFLATTRVDTFFLGSCTCLLTYLSASGLSLLQSSLHWTARLIFLNPHSFPPPNPLLITSSLCSEIFSCSQVPIESIYIPGPGNQKSLWSTPVTYNIEYQPYFNLKKVSLIWLLPGFPSSFSMPPLYLKKYIYLFMYVCMYLFIYFWSRHVACGILVPRPRIEPMPPCSGRAVLTTGPPEKTLPCILAHSIQPVAFILCKCPVVSQSL